MTDYDVAIIGAGPAGLTAGIYCARYGLKTVIIEKSLIGGTVTLASSIQNYPGFDEIGGMDLMQKFQEQAEKAGAKIELGTVEKVKTEGTIKEITLQEKKITSKVIIVTTGAKSMWLKVKGEKEFLNKGVHFCATCDGPMYNGKEVAVIGSDNRAATEAVYLATVTKKVYLISSKKNLTADAAKIKMLNDKKVEVLLNSSVKSFEGKETLEKINLKNSNGKETSLPCSAAFIYIGSEPSTEFINAQKDADGLIIVNSSMETGIKGVFAAGDCIKKDLYQIATCVGEGATAAHSAQKYLHEAESE